MLFMIKVAISAVIIAGASELGKRSTGMGALLAALPVNSILTLTWIFYETKDPGKVSALSCAILWAIIPSSLLLLLLPALLKRGFGYAPALAASSAVTLLGYWVYARVAGRFGVQF